MITPTIEQYGDFQAAYEHFNLELFGGALPDVMLTLARTRHANGYIVPDGFKPRTDGQEAIAEIGLNPETFEQRTAVEVLSTLAHEMVHLAQHIDGKASAEGFHNRDWANRMKAIGLYPSSTGKPGGAETGQRMTHYIVEGGPFEAAAMHLIANGWELHWFAPPVSDEEKQRRSKRRQSKTKYTCPVTGANAWAKPGLVFFTEAGYQAGKAMEAEASQ